MIRSYLKIALRTLIRDGVYSVTNISGLAIGISTFVLLMLWVQDEVSFDQFHPNADRIFRLNANFNHDGNMVHWSSTPGPIAGVAKTEIPNVEEAGRISGDQGLILIGYDNKTYTEDNTVAYVDPVFFSVFNFPLIKGNVKHPFPDDHSIIITEKIAKKYFGDQDPMGKVLRYENKEDYKVSGVARDIPGNSTIRYDLFLPFDILVAHYEANDYWKSLETDWGNYNYFTFLLLRPNSSPQAVADQLTKIHISRQKEASKLSYSLQPITAIHLYNIDMSENGIQAVRIFFIVAIAILAIACINYLNLATARATRRSKEVGVRKTIGASRSKLIIQFLCESSFISVCALLVAIVIIELAMPVYNEVSGKNITFNLIGSENLLMLGGTLLITWLAAGIYPAIAISSFEPLQVFRGKAILGSRNAFFRKILVVAQFTASIAIIVGTVVVSRQLSFIRTRNLGYEKENTFTFGLRGDMFKNKETIQNDLLSHPGISAVTMGGQNILNLGATTGDTQWEGQLPGQTLMIHPMDVKYDFDKVMKLQMVEGRFFRDSRADSAGYILNEAAVRQIGIKDPVGKMFTLWQTKGTIIGVVKDFHHASMKQHIEPTILFNRPDWLWMVYAKTSGKDNPGAIATAEKIWKRYNPEYPFDYSFMDASFDRMYRSEQRIEKLFTFFAVVAIFISCLGLFGLATFTASQRLKEIGVRKVMGASTSQIAVLLSKDFMKLMGFSLIVAIPLSYLGMQNWLRDFAYRIDIDWTIFAWSGILSILVALVTVSSQTIRAAVRNPVDSLRSE